MKNKLFSIGQTSVKLGVSIDTLRRWDKAKRLCSIRIGQRGHRYYRQEDIDLFLSDDETEVFKWAKSEQGYIYEDSKYCQTRDVFQARLEKFQSEIIKNFTIETVSLLIAVSGEIGNNSFDHNLGNWPDIPGIFFSYSLRNRKVFLADRGQGILATLKRVKPELTRPADALETAFTDVISGRMPEARGNGLKFVRAIISNNPFSLYFRTGDAILFLKQHDKDVNIRQAENPIQGCLAVIGF